MALHFVSLVGVFVIGGQFAVAPAAKSVDPAKAADARAAIDQAHAAMQALTDSPQSQAIKSNLENEIRAVTDAIAGRPPAADSVSTVAEINTALAAKDYDKARTMATSSENRADRTSGLFALALAEAADGKVQPAQDDLKALHEEDRSDLAEYASVLVYSRLGMFDQALQIARASDDSADREKYLLAIALDEARAGRSTDALAAADEIASGKPKSDIADFDREMALSSVAYELANAGKYDEALSAIAKVSDKVLLADMIGARAYILASKGDYSAAHTTAMEPVTIAPDDPDAPFVGVCYAAALQTQKGDIVKAQLWAQSLSDPVAKAQAYIGIAQGVLGQATVNPPDLEQH